MELGLEAGRWLNEVVKLEEERPRAKKETEYDAKISLPDAGVRLLGPKELPCREFPTTVQLCTVA